MSPIVWIAIGIAAVAFLIFAAWPLCNTYRTRGQRPDVHEGQAYLEAKQEWQQAEAAHDEGRGLSRRRRWAGRHGTR